MASLGSVQFLLNLCKHSGFGASLFLLDRFSPKLEGNVSDSLTYNVLLEAQMSISLEDPQRQVI